ncbi:unnamed protein product [Hermetia illucens]|uniref:MARVEL domain-containing protein n=1 Tax=Hermetia illucens TaxID=343691 RepID=A0A7R8UZC6_HERIL|nr:unnamed protein product [Hermetia illucens]
MILGIVCTGIVAYYSSHSYIRQATPELFFLLMVVTFMIATFCLLASCLISLSTGGIISKTIYELIYHSIAFILLLAAGLTLLIEVNHYYKYTTIYDPYMAASIICLVNAALYCASAVLAQRSYRGI